MSAARWLLGLVVLGLGSLGVGVAVLDRWQPVSGTPDEVSRRFLKALPPATTPEAEVGRALVAEAGCVRCHTADLGGGVMLTGPFGHVKTANLTSDLTGLHHETPEVLINAVRKGIDDDGQALPNRAMPWDLVGHLSDAEIRSVLVYLQSVPLIRRGNAHLLAGGSANGEIHQPLDVPPLR